MCKFPIFFFTPATLEEVAQIIMFSRNKCCDLDPLPTVS